MVGRLTPHAEKSPGDGLQSVLTDRFTTGPAPAETALVDQREGDADRRGRGGQRVGQLIVGPILDDLGHVVTGPLPESGAFTARRGSVETGRQFRLDLNQTLFENPSVLRGRHRQSPAQPRPASSPLSSKR